MKLKRAKAKIAGHHCRLGRVSKKSSTVRKTGKVLAQAPRPGRRLKHGARINLVLGKGPRKT